ncbi:unnamed protein product [Adineta steineri]|uniref:Uncharacterized protein n=1 Tax=Adineta steineri TaxID=433720 RepID=A0A819HAV5_9BILA|nr:unnamed protein product [Adineta steineri]
MQMSKCLCLMIIAVIIIATNASPARKRRSGSGSGCTDNNSQGNSNDNPNTNNGNGENYTLRPGQYTYSNNPYYLHGEVGLLIDLLATKQYVSPRDELIAFCDGGEGLLTIWKVCTVRCKVAKYGNSDRRKRNSGSSLGNLFGSSTNSEQTACDNVATSGTSGTQYNGCDSTQDCCTGNTVNGLVSLQCSSASLPSN